jgi:hypothetical protein
LRSGARFVRQAMVLDAARSGDAPAIAVRRTGPALLFERLCQETGCQDGQVWRASAGITSQWSAVFLTVLHRLMRGCAVRGRATRSDRKSLVWTSGNRGGRLTCR